MSRRPTFADPRTDFVFKRIFGSEERKDVLVAFLNDMLDLDKRTASSASSCCPRSNARRSPS